MKKYIPVFLVLLLLSTLFVVSCGEDTTTTGTTTTTTGTTTTGTTTTTGGPGPTTTTTTTTVAPGQDKYGGTLVLLAKQAPATNLGRPPLTDDYIATYALFPVVEKWTRAYEDATWEPWLASSVDIADDLSSIDMTIRSGVKFHDGTDLDGEAARWNLEKDMASGRYPWIEAIEKTGPMSVRIDLKYYDNTIPASMSAMTAISPTAVLKNGDDWARWNPVGTGPFVFAEFKKDVSLKMVRNENYWQPGLPYLDAIEWHYIPDDMTRSAAFLSGEGHIVRASAMDAQNLIAQGYELVHQPLYLPSRSVIEPSSMNPDSPLSDVRVREAVWLAIDREAIAAARGFGLTKTCEQFAAPGQPGYIEELDTLRGYNLERAKELMAEAGYADGFDAELYPNPGGVTDPDTMVAIQGFLRDIGIRLEIVNLDQAAHTDLRYNTGWKNGFIAISQSTNPNIAQVMKTFMSDQCITKHSMYTSPEFNEAMYAALATEDVRADLMAEANRLAWEGAFAIPYQYQPTAGRLNVQVPEVHDFGINTMNNWQGYTPELTWLEK